MQVLLTPVSQSPIALWHPLVGVAAYLCVNRLLRALRLDWSQSPWFKGVVLGHNLLLCVYSGWTLVTALSLLAWSDLVDVNGEAVFAAPGFAGLAHLFYWSKYYEFFDTWIHYLKSMRLPSTLDAHAAITRWCEWFSDHARSWAKTPSASAHQTSWDRKTLRVVTPRHVA